MKLNKEQKNVPHTAGRKVTNHANLSGHMPLRCRGINKWTMVCVLSFIEYTKIYVFVSTVHVVF